MENKFKPLSLALVGCVVLFAVACQKKSTGAWGGVSEEAFKGLHELNPEKPPALQGEIIEVGGARAYLSLPDATPPVAGVVVIHEWWGMNEHIQHWADRLASQGYAALAVDLYGGAVATSRDEAMAAMKSVDGDEARKVLAAAHAFLGEDARVQAKKRGVIGWCFGGGWSLQHALHTKDLDAAVIYYGRLVTDEKMLSGIRSPVLGIFGNQDQGIAPKVVNEFEAALKTAGVEHAIYRYDAPHAFANPSSARYDQASAAKAWARVQAFFATHLGN